ncbi:MAG TPA: DUF998 domain-containing protein [Gammaproteobacteria bacterium]|jgi:hypothetical membrane protein
MRSPSPAVLGALALPSLSFFLGTSLALQYLRSDYDWVAAPLSFYLIGPYSAWLIAGFFALALGTLCVALGLRVSQEPAPFKRVAVALFVVDAVATCLVTFADTDLPGGPRHTAHGLLHYVFAATAFLSVSLGMLAQSWSFRRDDYWRRHFRTAFSLAVLTFAALCVYVLWRELPRGLSEKIVILLIVLWLLMAGRWLMQTRLKTADSA